MAKLSRDYVVGKNDGLTLAYRLVTEQGIEALKEEINYRGAVDNKLRSGNEIIQEKLDFYRKRLFDSIRVMSVMVLRDEFGFGKERISRFLNNFNFKVDCLGGEDDVHIEDYVNVIEKELGIKITMNWRD